MIIYTSWTTKKGKRITICIAWGKDKGACDPKPTTSSPIFNGDDGDVTVLVNNRKFASEEMFILSDENGRYGRVSEIASEFSLNQSCHESKDIVKLSDIHIENNKTKERLSIQSLISLLKNQPEVNDNDKSKYNCSCSS